MKKTLTVITMLAGAVSGYSQGVITFSDYSVSMQQQVFNVQSTAPANGTATPVTVGNYTVGEYQGSTSVSTASGTTVYAANTALSGTSFDAQLLTGAGSGDALSSLTVEGTVLHFYTTSAAVGDVKGTSTVNLPGGQNGAITVAFAAWAINSGGLLGAATTLAEAQADTATGDAGYAWGASTTANVTVNSSIPTQMPTTIEGFSLGVAVPEPSTIALGVIGASALLFRRRK